MGKAFVMFLEVRLQGNSGGFPNFLASDWLAEFGTAFAPAQDTVYCTDYLVY